MGYSYTWLKLAGMEPQLHAVIICSVVMEAGWLHSISEGLESSSFYSRLIDHEVPRYIISSGYTVQTPLPLSGFSTRRLQRARNKKCRQQTFGHGWSNLWKAHVGCLDGEEPQVKGKLLLSTSQACSIPSSPGRSYSL